MTEELKKTIEYSPENEKVFDELLALCVKGLIVPYVGAGMSAFKFPLWNSYINNKKSYLRNNADELDNIDIAEELEKELGKENFYNDIHSTFGGKLTENEWSTIIEYLKKENEKDEYEQPVSYIPKIFRSPIITTNFDQILEKLTNIPVAFLNNLQELERVKDNRASIIYKIHGCVSDIGNIVFTKNAYNKVYAYNTPLVKSLSDFFTTLHFLFLGCSLAIDDSDTKEKYIELWEKLQQKQEMYHYAILPCEKDKIPDRRNKLKSRKIHAIFYENKNGKHEEVKIIIKGLWNRLQEELFEIPKFKLQYTERKDSVIKKIENKLENSKYSVLALIGDGGVGKTRIISEYAKNIKEQNNRNVFWFNIISIEFITEEIRKFVVKYNGLTEDVKDIKQIINSFIEWTKNNDNYLFLLDNIDNVEVYAYIKKIFFDDDFSTIKGTRHILITSRLNEKELNNIPFEKIEVFGKEDAQSFFQSHTEDKNKYNEEYEDKIANLLGYLPLALEQATAYINETKISYQEYFKELEKTPFDLLEQMHPEPGAVSVAATWNMAIQRIKKNAAKELLNLCAFFAPDNIHSQWFVDALEVLPENLKSNIQTELNKIEDQLKKYSLVKIDNGKISIHRLLQGVIQKMLNEEQEIWVDFCVEITKKLIYTNFNQRNSIANFNQISPHIVSIVTKIPVEKQNITQSNLFKFLGYGNKQIAYYTESLKWFNTLKRIQENELGFLHSDMISTCNVIAEVYCLMENFKYAWNFNKQALNICYNLELHEKQADIFSDFALIRYSESKYKKALWWSNRALKIRIKGDKLEDIANSYLNKSACYYKLNNYEKFLEFSEKSKEAYEKSLGTYHPRTALSYNNIAMAHSELGNHTEAIKMYDEAISIYEEIFGEKHPETAKLYHNKALGFSKNKDYDNALTEFEKALRVKENRFGKNHLSTANTYFGMAEVYDKMNKYEYSLNYYLKSYKIRKEKTGITSIDTVTAKDNMKIVYLRTNNPIPFEEWIDEQLKTSTNDYITERYR